MNVWLIVIFLRAWGTLIEICLILNVVTPTINFPLLVLPLLCLKGSGKLSLYFPLILGKPPHLLFLQWFTGHLTMYCSVFMCLNAFCSFFCCWFLVLSNYLIKYRKLC
jgi:hypothetical protein